MAATVRWLSLVVWLAALTLLIGRYPAQFAKDYGLFEQPDELLAWLARAADLNLLVARHPVFDWTVMAASAFAAGAWLEWLALRSTQSRGRKRLGRELVSLAQRVDDAQGDPVSGWPRNVRHLLAELRDALVRVSQFGIWIPDRAIFQRPNANVLISYLTVMGTLLLENRLAEAKEDALRCRDVLRAERARRHAATFAPNARERPDDMQAGPRIVEATVH